MSPVQLAVSEARLGFPRVSGDEPRVDGERAALAKFSPRERG